MNASLDLPKRQRLWLKRLVWSGACLVLLVALAIVIENWTGARAWKAYVKQAEASGGSLELGPPAIPDAENFAAHPFVKALIAKDPSTAHFMQLYNRSWRPEGEGWKCGQFTDLTKWCVRYREKRSFPKWKEHYENLGETASPADEILAVLRLFDPELNSLRDASERQGCYFFDDNDPLRQTSIFGGFSLTPFALQNLIPLRASAELVHHRTDEAFEDIMLSLQLAQVLSNQPYLVLIHGRVEIISSTIQPIWEGLHRKQWNDSQLAHFEAILRKVDFTEDFKQIVRAETNFTLHWIDSAKSSHKGIEGMSMDLSKMHGPMTLPVIRWFQRRLPDGWYDHNKVAAGKMGDHLLSCVDTSNKRFDVRRIGNLDDHPLFNFGENYRWKFLFWSFNFDSKFSYYWRHDTLTKLAIPSHTRIGIRLAAGQTYVNLARISIALERHRLLHHDYPETLTALDTVIVPEDGLPVDVTDGSPAHYKRISADRFLLYFNGWDKTDNGGRLDHKGEWVNSVGNKVDWVWPMPAE